MHSTLPVPPAFDEERFAAGKFTGVLEILDANGDTKVMWDVANASEVEIAREFFAMARANGMLTFAVPTEAGSTHEDAEIVREFDPAARTRIIISPQLVGG